MKRIILGLSLVLMLSENGFATSDTEYNAVIAEMQNEYEKQEVRCEREANNHLKTSSAIECVRAVEMLENLPDSHPEKKFLASLTFNAGQLYFFSEDNKIKAYEYWHKSMKLGNKHAHKNLNELCTQYSWACK